MPTTIVTIDEHEPEHLLVQAADLVYQDLPGATGGSYLHKATAALYPSPGLCGPGHIDWLIGRSHSVLRLVPLAGQYTVDVVKDEFGHIKNATDDMRTEIQRRTDLRSI
jgi:hypothetical protein